MKYRDFFNKETFRDQFVRNTKRCVYLNNRLIIRFKRREFYQKEMDTLVTEPSLQSHETFRLHLPSRK